MVGSDHVAFRALFREHEAQKNDKTPSPVKEPGGRGYVNLSEITS